MEGEVTRPLPAVSSGSGGQPATLGENLSGIRCTTPLSATSSDHVLPDHIKATFVFASKSKVVTQEGDATVLSPVLNVNGVASRTFDTGSTIAASREETLDLISLTMTCQEAKYNREFCVQDPTLHGPPRVPENVAVVATGSDASGNVNQVRSAEGNPFMIPKEEFAPVELPASNSLDYISSAMIQESFEAPASPHLCSTRRRAHFHSDITQQHITTAPIGRNSSPCNGIAVPDVASTATTPYVLKSAAESNIGNVSATSPVKPKDTQVPVAVTYADATNLAAQYPDLASQILVSPLRMRTASQEVALAEQESAENDLPSKRRRPRRRRPPRLGHSRDDCEQYQSRGDSGSAIRESCRKDLSSASGSWRVVDPKVTPRFQRTHLSQRPGFVDLASRRPSRLVERTPSPQTNCNATLKEKMHSHARDNGDVDWDTPTTAGMWATKSSEDVTPPSTRRATLSRTPAKEQRDAVPSWSERASGATNATDLTASSDWRRGEMDVLLTKVFHKAMDTGAPPTTKNSRLERKCDAGRPYPTEALVRDTRRQANLVGKTINGDSTPLKLPAPVTPPMRALYKPPAARTEEDHVMYQHYRPLHRRANDNNLNATTSYTPPLYLASSSNRHPTPYVPPPRTAESLERGEDIRHSERLLTREPNVPPVHNAALDVPSPKPLYLASPLKRHPTPYMPPSPRTTELLERSEHIRYFERLLTTERDLSIDMTWLDVPSPTQSQELQPIGPCEASDERAFHRRSTMNPGTNTNQSSDFVRAMQAMGLGISSKADTSTLGTGGQYVRANVLEQSYDGFDGVRQWFDPMMADEPVLRDDLADLFSSEGSRSPRGGECGSVIWQSSDRGTPATQWAPFG